MLTIGKVCGRARPAWPWDTGQPNAGGDGAADGNAGGNQAVANETKYTQPGNRTLVDLSINENSDLNSRMLGDYTQPDPPETPATEELVMNSDDDPVLKPLLHTPEINASDQLVFRDDAGRNTAIDSLEKNAPPETPAFNLTSRAAAAQIPDAGSTVGQGFRNLKETRTRSGDSGASTGATSRALPRGSDGEESLGAVRRRRIPV